MGIQDFAAVFDSLDLACDGFITCEKVHQFDEILHYGPVSFQHVHAAVSQICGGDGNGFVDRDNFLAVLQELERRRAVEERAYWDFQALDNNADGKLPLKDALLLFRDTHGENFSVNTWEMFLAQRETKCEDVCFDELRMWLCLPPGKDSVEVNEELLQQEEEKLEKMHLTHAIEEYDSLKHWQEGEAVEEKEKKQYQDSLLEQAERKQKKWDREGIESLLFDDGKEVDAIASTKSLQRIGIKDVYQLLEQKYFHLRQKLVWAMVTSSSDGILDEELSGEVHETYREVENQVKQMWKSQTLGEKWAELPGSSSRLQSSLSQLMGDLMDVDVKRKAEVAGQYVKLLREGKSSSQACQILGQKYQDSLKGSQAYGGILSDLLLRYNKEKEAFALTVKTWVTQVDVISQISTQYFSLLIQDVLIETESHFEPAALACGLAERRQKCKSKGYDWDRSRMEKLAALKLAVSKGRQPRKLPHRSRMEVSSVKKSELDLQTEIINKMVEVFMAEKEIFINMLQGRDSVSCKANAKKMSAEERRGKLNSLRSQRKSLRDSMTPEAQESQKVQQRKLLQEAVGLAYEDRFQELMKVQPNVTEDAVNSDLLADFQQKHYMEMDNLIRDFISKDSKELKRLLKPFYRALTNEHLDTVAFVILGSLDVTEEERWFVDALDHKYEVIRETILLQALRKQHGSVWERMTKEERQKELRIRKKEEKKLRGEGRWKDMISLLGSAVEEMEPLDILMGENKLDYNSRTEEDEKAPETRTSSISLADLVVRQEAEQNYVLDWLRSPEVKAKTIDHRRMGLVKILLEKLCVEQEIDYDIMGYRLGLVERIDAVLSERHNADKKRVIKLSVLRCKDRRHRLNQNKMFKKRTVPSDKPAPGDWIGWQMLYLNQVTHRQLEEVEYLLQLCQDETLAELREVAQTMTNDEKQKRLSELRNKRKQLDIESQDGREENLSILEEATAIKTLTRKAHLEKENPGDSGVTMDDVASSLLQELFDLQDRELALILQSIIFKDETELGKCFTNEVNARRWEMVENVVTVITKYEGLAKDDDLLQALEDKYDALRDKLLADYLMGQLGEAEWKRLGEEERQRRLALLKLQERKLRQEGKMDELGKLLGDFELAEKNLRGLLGDNRAEAERRLRERLAERQRRIAQGEDVEDEEDIEDDTNEQNGSRNILCDLSKRYEEERDALLASLKGREAEYWGEKERQAELLRLKRERRKAEREGRFDEAALVLGLAERQQQQLNERLKKDRERQEMLAQKRLEELRQKKGKKDELKDEVIKQGDRIQLQEAVLSLLDGKHSKEQEKLFEMMSEEKNDLRRKEARVMSGVQREDLLADLKYNLQQLPNSKSKERTDLLQQGVAVKMESRHFTMCHTSEQEEVSDDLVRVSLMADLQEEQAKEVERLMSTLQDMNEDQLVAAQEEILSSKTNDDIECVMTVVFCAEGHDKNKEGELITALEEKYDALRDKLLIEALMKQAGELNWKHLSEQERQRRLLELKLKERKLRKENKMDELSRLLGDDIKNKEALEKFLGESKEEQRRKLQEKLEKRRQRMAEGMSNEECDELETAEAEEEAKKPRNVLLDLQSRFDEEKAELLRRLHNSDSKFAEERQRQLELVRLKREQRKVHQEENFESAALVLGLAREAEERMEKNMQVERERQQRLARERLEARKNKKYSTEQQLLDLPTLGDSNDLIFLQESVCKEIDTRHRHERDCLIQLIQDCDIEGFKSLSETDIHRELTQLQLSYANWSSSESLRKDKGVLHNILKPAVGIQIIKKEMGYGGTSPEEDPKVALLADLQQVQDKELQNLKSSMSDKDVDGLKNMKASQSMIRSDSSLGNLAAVLLERPSVKDHSDSSDDAILQALDMKYDAFRDKLFAEAARGKMGDNWWKTASEDEKMRIVADLKLQDQQLRDEGKHEEANTILEDLLNNAGCQGIIKHAAGRPATKDTSATPSESRAKLEENYKRQQKQIRKIGEDLIDKIMGTELSDEEKKANQEKLRQERLAEGLSMEEILKLEESQEEVDGQVKRKNVLDTLHHFYDDEKAALLASLEEQGDRLAVERKCQLELAKLRRDNRRLKQEEKIDSAALLFTMAHEQETKLKMSLEEERERQRGLARERLAARRQQKQGTPETNVASVEEKLIEQHHNNLLADSNDKASVENILHAVEVKQTEEREMLLQLLQAVHDDTASLLEAHSQTTEDIQKELQTQKDKRDQWLMSVQQIGASGDAGHDAAYIHQLSTSRTEQFPLWQTVLSLKCEALMRQKSEKEPNRNRADLWDEVSVDLLADLQTRQALETDDIQAALLSVQDEAVLKRAKSAQRRACAEGWYITLAEVIYSSAALQEDAQYQESVRSAQAKAKAEGLSAEETDAILKNLQSQREAQIKRTNSVRKDQQKQVQEKLELRRRRKSFKDDSEDEALSLLLLSGAQAEVLQDLSKTEKTRQNSLMQERLAQRRAARKKVAEQGNADEQSRPSTRDSAQSGSQRLKPILNVEVTDDEKHAAYVQLVRQQSNVNRKISEQQSRQEEMLKRRLEENRSHREKETAAVLSLGEKQKSTLEHYKQEERDRQVSRVQERVARVRYERTMTMRDRSRSPASRTFDQVKEEAETSGITEDDKMNKMAQDMENKFKENDESSKDGLMTEESRLDRMKQRRAQKREKRITFAATPE